MYRSIKSYRDNLELEISKTYENNEIITTMSDWDDTLFPTTLLTKLAESTGYGDDVLSMPVPNYLIKHFIRGYMDGDGGISYWIDNKNTGHKKFNINFCGTSDIIINISKILSDKFNCCPAMSDRYEDRDNNNLQVVVFYNIPIHL